MSVVKVMQLSMEKEMSLSLVVTVVDGKIYMPMSYSGDNEHVISSSKDGCVFLSNPNETSNPYKWIV